MSGDSRNLKVVVPSGYPNRFCFNLGQRNATFVERRLVRGSRFLPFLDAITLDTAKDADLLHTLNAIPLRSKKPHIITFESFLPRVPDDRYNARIEKFLFAKLLKPECKRIVAFSEYALNQFKTQIGRYQGFESLLDKTEILYPAAEVRKQAKFPPMKELRLLFVGRQFMHKGGPVVTRTHEMLQERGVPVQTTVVSSLDWSGKGLVGPNSLAIVEGEYQALKQHGITHYREVENEGVLKLIDASHFVLLPTVNDTFGFSCLEALASATPVIATNSCALPEMIEDGHNGYLLDMPTDAHGRWTTLKERQGGDYDRLYLQLIDDLAKQMTEKLASFWNESSIYPELSANASATVEKKFNRDRARTRLEELYAAAV